MQACDYVLTMLPKQVQQQLQIKALLQTFVAIFLLPQSLRKVEVSSTFRNSSRNVARNFSHVAQSLQPVSQRLMALADQMTLFVHVRFIPRGNGG